MDCHCDPIAKVQHRRSPQVKIQVSQPTLDLTKDQVVLEMEDESTSVGSSNDVSYQADNSPFIRRITSSSTDSFGSLPDSPTNRLYEWETSDINELQEESPRLGGLVDSEVSWSSSSPTPKLLPDSHHTADILSLQKDNERSTLLKCSQQQQIHHIEREKSPLLQKKKKKKKTLETKQGQEVEGDEETSVLRRELSEARRHIEMLKFAWNESRNTHTMDIDICADQVWQLQSQLEKYKAENAKLRKQLTATQKPVSSCTVSQMNLPFGQRVGNKVTPNPRVVSTEVCEERTEEFITLSEGDATTSPQESPLQVPMTSQHILGVSDENEREFFRSRLVGAAQKLRTLQDELSKFQNTSLGQLQRENEMFQDSLDDYKTRIVELEEELIAATENSSEIQNALQSRLHEYRDKMIMARDEMSQAKAWINSLLDELRACQALKYTPTNELSEMNAVNEIVSGKIEGSAHRRSNVEGRDLCQTGSMSPELRKEVDGLRKARQRNGEEAWDWKSRYERLEEVNARTVSQLHKLEVEKEFLVEHHRAVHVSLGAHEVKIAALLYDNSRLRQDLATAVENVRKTEQELGKAMADKERCHQEASTFRDQLEALRQESIQMTTRHLASSANLRADVDRWASANAQLQDRFLEQATREEQLQSLYHKLEADSESLQIHERKLETDVHRLRQLNASLTEENNRLHQSMDQNLCQFSCLEVEMACLKDQHHAAQNAIAQLAKEKEKLEVYLFELEQNRNDLKKQLLEVEKKQSDCIHELHSTVFGI